MKGPLKKDLDSSLKKDLKFNVYYPLGIAIFVVLLLTLFSLVYHYPGVGNAIRVSPTEPLDLTIQGEYQVDVQRVSEFEIGVDTSSDGYNTYDIVIIVLDKKAQYEISESGRVMASGYLGSQVSHTEGLYLDDDVIADLRLSYNDVNDILSVSSPLYITPSTSQIELYDGDGNKVDQPRTILVGENYLYSLRVSSTSSPTVAVYFADELPLTVEETTISPGTSRTYDLTFSPTATKPYELVIESNVGGQVTVQNYLFGGDGVVYQLSTPQYPRVKITLVDEQTQDAEVELTFTNSGKQPFSLPCSGSVTVERLQTPPPAVRNPMTLLEMVADAEFSSVYSYSVQRSIPQQYVEGIPSDFYYLDALKGYLLDVSSPVVVKSRCRLSSELPALQRGWNMVGLTGLQPRLVSDLSSQVPPGLSVQELYEVQLQESYVPLVGTELLPGKVYWVLVS